jgi:hypothetical protein
MLRQEYHSYISHNNYVNIRTQFMNITQETAGNKTIKTVLLRSRLYGTDVGHIDLT